MCIYTFGAIFRHFYVFLTLHKYTKQKKTNHVGYEMDCENFLG